MPRSKLEDQARLTDPYLTYNWDLIVPNMPGVAGYDVRDFKARITTTTLPGREIETLAQELKGGVERQMAGKARYGQQLPFETYVTRDMKGRDELAQWNRFTRDDDGLGAYYNEYVRRCELHLFDEKDVIIRRIALIDCWLPRYEDIQLGSQSDMARMGGTLQYWRHVDV